MRNLKKVLALVVAFSMMLSVVAFAGYKDVPADAEYAGALDLLSALEIIKGDDLGNFNPDATITRAEMAAIVCRAKGLESAANGAKGATVFTDVAADHWASGYINLANQNNIINGYGDGKFGPEDTVTYEQVIKMLVCALGFEPMAAAKGGWATGYLVVANTYKITEGAAADATRKNVATLVYNALSTPMMDQTTFGADAEYEILNGKNGEYKTLLTDMDIYIATGTVQSFDKADASVVLRLTQSSDDGEFIYSKVAADADEKTKAKNDVEFTVTADPSDYLYQSVEAYVKKTSRKDYEVVALVGSVMGETLTILSDDVVKDAKGVALVDGEFEYYIDAANSSKTKTVKFSGSIELNKAEYKSGFDALVADDDVEITLIENTSDRTFDMIVATKYESARVGYVDVDRDKIEIDSAMITLDFEDEDKTIILVDEAGKELTLADFAEDDVVAYIYAGKSLKAADYIKVIKLADAAVTGVVDETFTSNDAEYVVINGEEYRVDCDEDLAVGSEGTFYIGITGKVVDFDGDLVGQNYAYVLEAAKSTSSFSAEQWQIKLLTKEDGIVTYDVTKEMNDKFDAYLNGTGDFAENKDVFCNEDKDGKDSYLFEDADVADKANPVRLITYKTNARGEIRAFDYAKQKKADGKRVGVDFVDTAVEYNERTQKISTATLEDEITIFVVDGKDVDDAYVTDLSYLIDESEYKGYVFTNDDSENDAMIVIDGVSKFAEEVGVAIVTKKSTTTDENDDAVTKISYVQDSVEGTVTFNDDSDAANGGMEFDNDKFDIGSIFLFNASNGVVTNYVIVATVEKDKLVKQDYSELIDAGKDNDAFFGAITNVKRVTNKKGEVLTVGSTDVPVAATANMYTYDKAGKKVAIRVGDFMDSEDMGYADADDGAISSVFVRIVDGVVVDIYGFGYAAK